MLTTYRRRPVHHFAHAYHQEGEIYRRLPVDVQSDEDSYTITASVPGLKVEDLKIEVLEDVISLSGEIGVPGNGDGAYLMRERGFGKFRRSLRLPDAVLAEKAEATIEGGVLTVTIPKAEETKPRMIKVKAR